MLAFVSKNVNNLLDKLTLESIIKVQILAKERNRRYMKMLYPNIRAEMGRNNLTIKMLAKEIGISSNSVSLKLNGKRDFTLSEVERMADLFGCSLDYLVGHEVKPPCLTTRAG